MEHTIHPDHHHAHGEGCGHTAIAHGDHVDYLHGGHLHSRHDDHTDEHRIETVDASGCDGGHACTEHDATHAHALACGHESIPHGDHADFVVGTHLHHRHGDHCDDHGVIALV